MAARHNFYSQNTAVSTPLDRPCTLRHSKPCWACHKLTKLDAEIAEVERKHAALVHQRVSLKVAVNQLHDPLLSKLPPEVISRVFLFCTPTMVNACHAQPYNAMFAEPLSLGAVCRSWRSIAWATPSLWASISIDIARNGVYKNHSEIPQIAKQWLERAGDLPLSINLYANEMKDTVLHGWVKIPPVLNIINQHSRRWRHLALKLPHLCFLYMCDNQGIEPPSSLESLYICRIDRDPPILTGIFHLNSLHCLRFVFMCCLDLEYLESGWENFSYVKLGLNLPITTCYKLLQMAPKLQHFEVRLKATEPSEIAHLKPTTHSELQTLYLGAFDAIGLAKQFFSQISLPALRNFSYSDPLFPVLVDSIIPFLSRSSTGLDRLFLAVYGAFDGQETDILCAIPSLTDLTLTHIPTPGIPEKLYKNLINSKCIDQCNEETLFLPNLQSLTIDGPKPSSWYSIPGIFDSRITSPDGVKFRPLRALTLILKGYPNYHNYMVYTDGLGIENIREFVRLRQQGIDLKIMKQSDMYGDSHDLISRYVDEWKL